MADAPDHQHLTPATVDFTRVARVASRVALELIHLVECEAELNVDLADVSPDWSSQAYVAFDTHPFDEPDDLSSFRTRADFLAVYVVGFDAQEATDLPDFSEAPPSVYVHGTFALAYEMSDPQGISNEDISHFAFANSTLHAWPYWRELAQSMTTRMGIPPLVIGTYKIPTSDDVEADEGDQDA